jgi:hypothetical protein
MELMRDGSMFRPGGVFVDAANLYLYVVDMGNSRIDRYFVSSGNFAGWIGLIGTSPTGGDPGCAGATVGTFTPGWCIGGTTAASTIGNGDGMSGCKSAGADCGMALYLDAKGVLYITDLFPRILRVDFQGK